MAIKKAKRKSNVEEVKTQLLEIKTELKDGVFTFTGPMTINEFSKKIKKQAKDVILHFFKQGKMYNANQIINEEEIAELCLEFDYEFKKEEQITVSNFMDTLVLSDEAKDLEERAPIITVMGHVDHGKTTLIDVIRKSKIVDTEAGGITQHTGAYQIEYNGKKITFIDTPGHEAFTQMRSRGAKVTDIVILVVAADDGVMPQTKEAIDHAKSANVPIIVFVNKMDKPNKDIDRILSALSTLDVVSEEWSGDTQFIYGSALKNQGIDKLFDAINLQAEILELKANRNRDAIGTIIESHLDKGKGSVSVLIVQNGTLTPRDFIVAGSQYGRIRSIEDTNGNSLDAAYPGTPVIVTGLNYVPNAGDRFIALSDESFAKNIAEQKAFVDKQAELISRNTIVVQDGIKVLNIILKADVQGIAEAIKSKLLEIKNEEVKINVVRSSVGAITKSDILLAQASNAIIFGFNIRATGGIKTFAEESRVIVKTHTIIYELLDEVNELLNGLKAPKFKEVVTGEARIKKIFFYSKVGNIAGCEVISGKVTSGTKMRLIRNGITVHEGILDSLQREKNQAREVLKGFEFGTHIKKFNDIKEDDIIQTFEDVQI
ncbi:translation initiation factor IF-2 [[Mycoplasma] mobile]|uniref:Translation initiation factor IF-2 n=1 Tax=Mycoplasma mobile (strain ATCC 43663 / 163K / NCTC 11711) TaxID=267748 RepID=IF2_MYCM1|nr:translation initiation factor IF-2 [[Mycoplasma] mobile]Q6KID8.1 RecName: Full=Translation initiation factor IF-2 [Mycoplasma mobile 163K]AAT27638.1 translation initiation factor if-2 [Mycoplasma mobile 163K]